MKELREFNYEQGIIDKIELMDKTRFEDPLKTIELACDFKKLAEKRADINLMGYSNFYLAYTISPLVAYRIPRLFKQPPLLYRFSTASNSLAALLK